MESLIPLFDGLNADVENVNQSPQSLPDLPPHFFVPRLADKPQNPIMDTLRMMRQPSEPTQPVSHITLRLPSDLELLVEDVAMLAQAKHGRLEDIWKLAALDKVRRKNQILSWDALRTSHHTDVVPSPFLSEQSSETFASARYHVRPPLHDPNVQLIYVHVQELFESLLLTISGTSSHLHIWDPIVEKFVLRDLEGKTKGQLVIVGKDEVVSASLLQRFLTIGNSMRRLELFSEHRDKRPSPSTHAFNHAISSILAHLRQLAEAISPNPQTASGMDALLAALWAQYENMEAILTALTALCGRDEGVSPSDYPPIPATATALLSLIYQHLAEHIERSSSHVVVGALAFVLTMTSRSYFESLCASVGYSTPGSHSSLLKSRVVQRNGDSWLQPGGMLDDGNLPMQRDEPEDELGDDYPDFIGAEVEELLSRARRSLLLLRAADPDHPLLNETYMHQDIEWVWTEEQIDNVADGISLNGPSSWSNAKRPVEAEEVTAEKDVLRAFKVFDLPPGASEREQGNGSTASLLPGSNSASSLRSFLETVPPHLPSSTPTLAHLTRHILNPLVSHAASLSGALVTRLLSPATPLHLHSHLVLLRGYLLLTSHAFKARLQDALFTDAEEVSAPVVGSRTYAAREARENARRERHRSRTESGRSRSRAASTSQSAKAKVQVPGRRAIGLSPALTVGDRWPPGGTDLNFHLRTVIVDSLEDGRAYLEGDTYGEEDERVRARTKILEEGEWRLGFAIRDLPLGTGRERWLNPLCAALDFLYMHYQPPHPLDVVITPAILSKYHRMFAFNLRLMRVENVVRTLFRLTRKASAPLFPTLTPANKFLLHFRFVAHGFIMGLSSYVYDIAIGSHMDAFLARLAAASGNEPHHLTGLDSGSLSASASGFVKKERQSVVTFSDVFELAEQHSRVLDDILSSCLLRSGQKAVGDILRQCMELVLELGVLAGDLKDGRLEEYEAAPALEELWGKFRAKMTTFVKVLRALVEKEADASGVVLSDIPLHMMQAHRNVSGTTANLHQLLLRLNMSDWWTKSPTSRPG
ncbi:hypothetical protein PYCCODRAFT_1364885 [Trametes coccinea BRFM310]|uniref:Spindle pole body component n=1 Tax=Trametes coccinea (strain BRFM310) TaxID=1353009 RepID=A0A1Y2ITR4_TRAC3|nr:hypothetical protein PYCCODRAFT_1364885 [Trametes coccinea BRFM310]